MKYVRIFDVERGYSILMVNQQVCFHSVMKHENDVGDTIGCLEVVRIYSFRKEIKLASYIAFLFVKSETNNFIKEIKHILRAFIVW